PVLHVLDENVQVLAYIDVRLPPALRLQLAQQALNLSCCLMLGGGAQIGNLIVERSVVDSRLRTQLLLDPNNLCGIRIAALNPRGRRIGRLRLNRGDYNGEEDACRKRRVRSTPTDVRRALLTLAKHSDAQHAYRQPPCD